MQLYANIDSASFEEYHRTIYVFLCVSEMCIAKKDSVRVFTCLVPHTNNLGVKFIEDDQAYNAIVGKTDNQLRALGYKIPSDAKKQKEDSKEQDDDQIID